MGKSRGRLANKRGLVDMGTIPPDFSYDPPDRGDCDPDHWVIALTDGHRLEVQAWVQRGKVVDFAIMQLAEVEGRDVHVARIDCCHGSVHRHVFDEDGNDLLDRQVIQVIPERHSAEVVDREYQLSLDKMLGEWRENVRQWGRM